MTYSLADAVHRERASELMARYPKVSEDEAREILQFVTHRPASRYRPLVERRPDAAETRVFYEVSGRGPAGELARRCCSCRRPRGAADHCMADLGRARRGGFCARRDGLNTAADTGITNPEQEPVMRMSDARPSAPANSSSCVRSPTSWLLSRSARSTSSRSLRRCCSRKSSGRSCMGPTR